MSHYPCNIVPPLQSTVQAAEETAGGVDGHQRHCLERGHRPEPQGINSRVCYVSIDHFVVIRRIPRLYLENHKRFAGILMAKV